MAAEASVIRPVGSSADQFLQRVWSGDFVVKGPDDKNKLWIKRGLVDNVTLWPVFYTDGDVGRRNPLLALLVNHDEHVNQIADLFTIDTEKIVPPPNIGVADVEYCLIRILQEHLCRSSTKTRRDVLDDSLIKIYAIMLKRPKLAHLQTVAAHVCCKLNKDTVLGFVPTLDKKRVVYVSVREASESVLIEHMLNRVTRNITRGDVRYDPHLCLWTIDGVMTDEKVIMPWQFSAMIRDPMFARMFFDVLGEPLPEKSDVCVPASSDGDNGEHGEALDEL